MGTRLFRTMLVLSGIGLALATACEDDVTGVRDNRFSAEAPFSFDVQVQDRTELRFAGINGTVKITGIPAATSISIVGTKRVESDSQVDADSHLDVIEVEVDSTETDVSVRTEQPDDSEGRNYIVDYTISVPADMMIEATQINGIADVRSISGDVSVGGVNGQIFVDDVEGDVTLTMINGQIDASITLPPDGLAELRVTNGTIRFEIPEETSAEFTATVANGTIALNNLSLSNEIRTPGSVTGTLGQGDGTITLRAANGNIAVEGV